MQQPILIILHQEHSTPGRVGNALRDLGYPLDVRRPRFEDPLPPTMAEHAGAIIFGGPMSANDPDDYIRREIDWIAVPLTESKPFLGICLGLQALFERSEEAPEMQGLGFFEGSVKRFPLDARVPHMGWNDLSAKPGSRLVVGRPYVYFAHSYYCPVIDGTSATCEYSDIAYTAVLEAGNVCGVQFHPEKSGPVGLEIVRRFVAC